MNKTIITIMGAAFLASLCCIGPIAMLVLGSTSVGLFTVFELIRPIFGVLSIIVLVLVYSKIFGKDKAACCETEEAKNSIRKQKHILLVITPIVFVLLAFPYFSGGLQYDNQAAVHPGMKSEWVIEGMTCQGCATGMEGSLIATKGMNYCKVSYDSGTMLCYTDNGNLTKKEIPALVNRNGFKAFLKTEKPPIGKG